MGLRVKPETLRNMKQNRQPIVVVTCYDYPTARIQDGAGVDVIFVGDSVGQNVLGYAGPQDVTMADMLHHTQAVRRGVQDGLLMVDLPFGSYQTPDMALENARKLVDVGAEVVKLEGGHEVAGQIDALVDAEIPVVGHLGYTPQTRLGKRPLFGDKADDAVLVYEDAIALEKAGVLGMVLECIPERVAEAVTARVSVPTIGIGAGRVCDGQVLVVHDLLGVNAEAFRFVKQYANVKTVMADALLHYCEDVRSGKFPGENHRFLMKRDELKAFRERLLELEDVANG